MTNPNQDSNIPCSSTKMLLTSSKKYWLLRCLMTTLVTITSISSLKVVHGKLADRSRVVRHRQQIGSSQHYRDNGKHIEGQNYRKKRLENFKTSREIPNQSSQSLETSSFQDENLRENKEIGTSNFSLDGKSSGLRRKLASQLTGCCYNYEGYSAAEMCEIYGHDCEGGGREASGSQDGGCSQDGLSFIGISFSVNTANGNPYSYQLCDQFPMENIIDRNYDYVMSMDEDGWLVGAGYKPFDYSGKMP